MNKSDMNKKYYTSDEYGQWSSNYKNVNLQPLHLMTEQDEVRDYIYDDVGCDDVVKRLCNDLWDDIYGISPSFEPSPNTHQNHEVVTNTVYGKSFNYCRDCKVEV